MELKPRDIRENYMRAVKFMYPRYTPCIIAFPPPTWRKYGEKLGELLESHKLLFPGFRREVAMYSALSTHPLSFKDEWGCLWRRTVDGLQGVVIENPLKDWGKLRELRPPDPDLGLPREGEPPIPWEEFEEFMKAVKSVGGLVVGFMPHGFLFLRLTYLRGYLNLLKDLIFEPPQLENLINIVTEYNVEVVRRIVRMGVDVVSFGDDLGTQAGLPFSPGKFRRLLLPSYERIFAEARRGGALVRFHSDGYVMDVAGDLVSAGVDVLNIQVDLNGLDRVEAELKGRVAIEAILDTQRLLPFGNPHAIDAYVRKLIVELGSRRGGLLLNAEVLHDVPLENIAALLDALERYSDLHRELPY